MDRSRIASTVAENLFATEDAVEDALARAAHLLKSLVDARRRLGLPADAGEDVMRRVSRSLEALGAARQEMVLAHGDLEALRRRAGLRLIGFGPLLKPQTGAADKQPTD